MSILSDYPDHQRQAPLEVCAAFYFPVAQKYSPLSDTDTGYFVRQHVYHDLRFYVCTFEDCHESPFSTSHEWFRHELDNDRRKWQCHLCNQTCHSAVALETHFASKHRGSFSSQQVPIFLKACEKSMKDFNESPCPFCNDWPSSSPTTGTHSSTRFRSHVGKHLQELAREALPIAIEGLEIKDDQDTEEEGEENETADDVEGEGARQRRSHGQL